MIDSGTPTTATGTNPEGGANESAPEMTRRRFLGLLFALASAMGLGAFAAPLLRFAYPVVKGQVFERLKVATVGQVPVDGIRFDYQEVPSHLIQLQDQTYAAYSLVCTHLGCIVKWEPRNLNFHCPCHAGYFDESGNVVSGPPPRPLTKYKLAIEGNDIFVEGLA
jgi:cytochrome b6-f complex iron-sulfur subunit